MLTVLRCHIFTSALLAASVAIGVSTSQAAGVADVRYAQVGEIKMAYLASDSPSWSPMAVKTPWIRPRTPESSPFRSRSPGLRSSKVVTVSRSSPTKSSAGRSMCFSRPIEHTAKCGFHLL